MSLSKMRMNIVLITFVFLCGVLLFFVDSKKLDALVDIESDTFVIREMSVQKESVVSQIQDSKLIAVSRPIEKKEWVYPVDGNYLVTTGYSYSHQALDIYSYGGYDSNILAANSGTVIQSVGGCNRGNIACNGRRGNYIVIRHNVENYYTVYMHLNQLKVRVGDRVQSGDVIATMGNTGNVIPVPTNSNPYGGTHLHFCLFIGEPYRGGYAVNPNRVF